MLAIILSCIGVLLALPVVALTAARSPLATPIVYGTAFATTAVNISVSTIQLLTGSTIDLMLPVGLPWVGANFHLDALSAFFLIVVNLGAALASLYAIGYGRHEHEPLRVLPFYPAFIAG